LDDGCGDGICGKSVKFRDTRAVDIFYYTRSFEIE